MRIVSGITAAALSVALCFGSTTAAVANVCQPGQAGCVLPVGVPAPVATPAPTAVEPVGEIIEETGINWLPILLGLAALGLGAYFLLDDDDEEVISP